MNILNEKINAAINELQIEEPPEGWFLAFSGGKDSIVCEKLLSLANVNYEAHYCATTIDPPEVLRYITKYYPHVNWNYATWKGKPCNFYSMIKVKDLPRRDCRWCCAIFKEYSGQGRYMIEGIRKSESYNRSKRQKREYFLNYYYRKKHLRSGLSLDKLNELVAKKKAKKVLNIIFDWSEKDIWDFIHLFNMPYCILYDQGYKRIGCIGCPSASVRNIRKDFIRYPTIALNIIKSITYLREVKGIYLNFDSSEDVFNWWISRKSVAAYQYEKTQLLLDI